MIGQVVMKTPLATFFLLIGLALGQGACGTDSSACGSILASESDMAPKLTDFQLNKQLDGDPWTLIFAATFEDSNGDLGEVGQARFYLSGQEAATLSLKDIFAQNGVPADANEGVLAMPLRFSETVSDGAQVVLGLQFFDSNSFASNCYSLGLEFNVEDVN